MDQRETNILTGKEIRELFKKHDLPMGHRVSEDKEDYIFMFPTHNVILDANVHLDGYGRVWHGDLDITFFDQRLRTIATKIGKPLFINNKLSKNIGVDVDRVSDKIKDTSYIIYPDEMKME